MVEKVIVDYDIKGRFQDSKGQFNYINRKSKKGGENLRRATASMETINFHNWINGLTKQMVRYFYDIGLHDRVITNRRRDFIESNGKMGISKREALEWYRYVYSFLSKKQLESRKTTFDKFTNQQLGIMVEE